MKNNILDREKLKEILGAIIDLENKNLKTKEFNNREMALKIKENIQNIVNK